MSTFCNIYLVDKINNWYCRKIYEKFHLTTPYWSMISSLLHLVCLRPRVYYTLINIRGRGSKAPLAPPQYANGTNSTARTALHEQHCTNSTARTALHEQHCTDSTARTALHEQHCTDEQHFSFDAHRGTSGNSAQLH